MSNEFRITGPGKYRRRDGGVEQIVPSITTRDFQWCNVNAKEKWYYRNDGQVYHRPHPQDLVELIELDFIKPIQIEVGKSFILRDGNVVDIHEQDKYGDFIGDYRDGSYIGAGWRADGTCCSDQEEDDIIAEVLAAPLSGWRHGGTNSIIAGTHTDVQQSLPKNSATTTASQANKDLADKAPLSNLTYINALNAEARVLEFGARKYGRDNWRKFWSDDTIRVTCAAILRHTFKILAGELRDPEHGEYHAAAVRVNAAFLIEYLETCETRDTTKQGGEK